MTDIFDLVSDLRIKPVNVQGTKGVSKEEQMVAKLKDRFPDGKLKELGAMVTSEEFTYLMDLLRIKGALEMAGNGEQKNYLSFPVDIVKIGLVIKLNSK
jgi:hypothetical protein